MLEYSAHAHIGAQICVHHHPDLEIELELPHQQPNEVGITLPDRDLTNADAIASADGRQMREVIIGAQREHGARQRQALGLQRSHDGRLLIIADQGMSTEIVETAGRTTPLEVAAMCVQPEPDLPDLPSHKPLLCWSHIAHGKVHVPAQNVSHLIGHNQLECEPRMPLPYAGEHRWQHLDAYHLAGAKSHRAAYFPRTPGRGSHESGS